MARDRGHDISCTKFLDREIVPTVAKFFLMIFSKSF